MKIKACSQKTGRKKARFPTIKSSTVLAMVPFLNYILLFDDIIIGCYGAQPEKIKKMQLLEDKLRNKEINSDEYFNQKDRYGLNTFRDCLYKFQEETGYTIVRCTKHELMEYQNFE